MTERHGGAHERDSGEARLRDELPPHHLAVERQPPASPPSAGDRAPTVERIWRAPADQEPLCSATDHGDGRSYTCRLPRDGHELHRALWAQPDLGGDLGAGSGGGGSLGIYLGEESAHVWRASATRDG